MDMIMMLKTATALFAAAALGGVIMAVIRFSGQPRPPSWLAMGHGLLAASGLTLLAYAHCTVGVPAYAQYALVLFLIAAIGGAAMNLLFHDKQRSLPIPLMIVHALLAVSAFMLLLLSVF